MACKEEAEGRQQQVLGLWMINVDDNNNTFFFSPEKLNQYFFSLAEDITCFHQRCRSEK